MAKLKPFKLYSKNFTEGPVVDEQEFVFECSVTPEGRFRVKIPTELTIAVNESLITGCRVEKLQVYFYVTGDNLDLCKRVIENGVRNYLSVVNEEELVILYGYIVDTAYAIGADGSKHPNGYVAEKETGKFINWAGNLSLSSLWKCKFYSVGLNASVQKKSTYRRANGVTVSYEKARIPDTDRNLFSYKLNAFSSIRDLNSMSFDDASPAGGVKEMPYTEEAAKFFYEAMMSLCDLSERIEKVLGQPPSELAKGIDHAAGINLLQLNKDN